ncbi:tetratricopeptide repeat protein [Amycolatopsis sp. NPDC024027]|uniref:ATP-binding protein n=1 Tax=Amycolatopsis sp. NPDC024027 TaxID=3154327 RepID=UPI003409BCB3
MDPIHTRNLAGGGDLGSVVQAGTIQQLSVMGTNRWWSAPAVPRQLPQAMPGFTGRQEQLAFLDAQLRVEAQDDRAEAVVITAVDGTGGVGKTTLALHWARKVERQFPDGSLFVNLRGYGPGAPLSPSEALEGFLQALGVPGEMIPPGIESQAGLYRSLLAGKRMLIVLDNANTPSQVRPLLPGDPGCLVLVTSRASLTGLVVNTSARRMALDLLGPDEARSMLGTLIGPAISAADPGQVDELIRLCARLPLALRIAAARVTEIDDLTIADLIAELADEPARLDTLSMSDDEEATVRAVFDGSYRMLDAAASRLFRLLGLFPGADISTHAAAALAGLDLAATRRLLGKLATAHLIEPAGRHRYRLHDLLRSYAAERAGRENTQSEREQAERRLVEWYAQQVAAGKLVTHPPSRADPFREPLADDLPKLAFSSIDDVTAWWDQETTNVSAVLRWSATNMARLKLTVMLLYGATGTFTRRGRWTDVVDVVESTVAAAQRSGEELIEAHMLCQLAEFLWDMPERNADRAIEVATRGLALAERLGRTSAMSWALNTLALISIAQRRYDDAAGYLHRARPLSAGYQNGRMEGVIEGNLSEVHACLGNHEQSLEHAERELVLRRRADDVEGLEFASPYHFALAYQSQGRNAEAVKICNEALSRLNKRRGHLRSVGRLLDVMAESFVELGDRRQAAACWEKALAIYDVFDLPRSAEIRAHLRGE